MSEWDREALINLREILANLYPTVDDARRVAADAGLRTVQIEFVNKAITTWFNILEHANARGKVDDVVKRALEDNPEDETLLRARDRTPPPVLQGPEKFQWSGPSAAPTLEKLMGEKSTLVPITYLEVGLVRARSVVRVKRQDGSSGTGFITDDNTLITNNHVLPNAEAARSSVIQFNYQQTAGGLNAPIEEARLLPEAFFRTAAQDDWSAVRIDGDISSKWGMLPMARAEVKVNKTCLSDNDFLVRNNNRLGIALAIRGQLTENATLLKDATGAFTDSLKHLPDSSEKAATQNNLGLALGELAKRENDTERYRDAKKAFEEALDLGKQHSHEFDAAPVRNNLGNVLVALGRREHDPAQLKQALHEYCAALKTWTREGVPCHWAAAQNNLCWTLLNIAKIEHDQNQLKKIEPDQNQLKQLNLAICSCLNALKEWPRGSPDRPTAHDNLGLAFTRRGELENDTASLNQGVNAHSCALEELTQADREWADAKSNLGTALVALGNRTGDTKLLEQALTAFDQALQYYKGHDKLKEDADDVRTKILEVEGRLAQPQGGSSSPALASEPSPFQPATPDSPTCEFSQSPCEDPCLALGGNSSR